MAGSGKGLHMVTFILLVIGGLNWGLMALGNWNIVSWLGPSLERIVYILVGLSAVYEVATHGKRCRDCKPGGI